MLNYFFRLLASLAIYLGAQTLHAGEQPVRLDATSATSAQSTFRRMVEQVGVEKRRALHIAVLKLNMAGVKSAYEVVGNPDLQSPSIVRIKDRVSGMTADEIIDLANRTSDGQVEIHVK